MPRLNDVFLVGIVAEKASIRYNSSGQIIQMALPLLVVHGTREYGERNTSSSYRSLHVQNKGYDNVWILFEGNEFSDAVHECNPYDVVEVKGVIRVSAVKKKAFCPECGTKHTYPSSKTTVYPIHFERRLNMIGKFGIKTFDAGSIKRETEDAMRRESLAYLDRLIEISNTIKLIGVVCRDPSLYQRDKDGRHMLLFPLAVIRKFYIEEDSDADTVDFVYIKMYGSNARANYNVLQKANLIMIDGFIHMRSLSRKIECPNCHCKYSIDDSVSEVVPYSVEYIRSNISDPDFRQGTTRPYAPQKVGSEADPDLKYTTIEEQQDDSISEVKARADLDESVSAVLGTLKG